MQIENNQLKVFQVDKAHGFKRKMINDSTS